MTDNCMCGCPLCHLNMSTSVPWVVAGSIQILLHVCLVCSGLGTFQVSLRYCRPTQCTPPQPDCIIEPECLLSCLPKHRIPSWIQSSFHHGSTSRLYITWAEILSTPALHSSSQSRTSKDLSPNCPSLISTHHDVTSSHS
jgi:hypothetical protein